MKAFFKGAARLLDVFGILSRQEVEPILAKSDAEAIRSDWEAIGKDFEKIFAVDWLTCGMKRNGVKAELIVKPRRGEARFIEER